MLISHKHKFIFIHIPRTGGSSITEALTKCLPDIQQVHEIHSPISVLEGYDDYRAIAFIRNPWVRALSLYAYHVRRRKHPTPQGFEEFLTNPPKPEEWIIKQDMMRQQVDYLLGHEVELGLFERLEKDFKALCKWYGLGDLKLCHRNAAAKVSVSEYYSDQTVELVSKLFPEDVQTLGYLGPY